MGPGSGCGISSHLRLRGAKKEVLHADTNICMLSSATPLKLRLQTVHSLRHPVPLVCYPFWVILWAVLPVDVNIDNLSSRCCASLPDEI